MLRVTNLLREVQLLIHDRVESVNGSQRYLLYASTYACISLRWSTVAERDLCAVHGFISSIIIIASLLRSRTHLGRDGLDGDSLTAPVSCQSRRDALRSEPALQGVGKRTQRLIDRSVMFPLLIYHFDAPAVHAATPVPIGGQLRTSTGAGHDPADDAERLCCEGLA